MAALRVLILGGTGFMGARATRSLLAAGHEVTTLSRGHTAPEPGARARDADRSDAASLAAALEGAHFDLTVDFCAYDSADVERLLLTPHAALGRYVLISSGQVYLVTEAPRTPHREEDSDGPLIAEPPAETHDHAQWSYGLGKRRAERAALTLRESHGVRAVVLRLPVIHGEDDPRLRLWAYLERMLDGGPLLLPDGGERLVRYLYAGDVAGALLRLIDEGSPRGTVYNLAQPEVLTFREFLDQTAPAAGCAPRFVSAPSEELEREGLDPAFSPLAGRWTSVLDPSLAIADMGFSATRLADWLPGVVRAHLERRPARSHAGYAQRAREIEVALRLTPSNVRN
ncbi:MAG: NAD-dependent epimerase/dehydratase family protein [Candidatus Eisenbacteria bacterium]|nr:NAD-dependent epimerase/dehydratase family protein [Candidatus Eisenbacteria bacterium]